MNKQFLTLGMIACLLVGCSFRNEVLIDPNLREAELLGDVAKAKGQEKSAKETKANVAEARKLQDEREYESSYAKSDEALLKARLALALAERDSAIHNDSLALRALSMEQQDKTAYQNILKERKAAHGGAQ